MAELAVGAVTSLLGLIRNEALLLGNLGSDVQFIKEEMESMNSFLKHLSKTAPRGPSGEPDEQVQTWMKQVRELAHDCSNCIDLYLQRGNPAAHRYYLSGSLLQRIACWAPWMVDKLLAQHYAANQLRELRRRAHDVGQRRLRYGVEVPKQPTGTAAEEATTAVASSSTLSNKTAAEAPVTAAPPAAVQEDNEVEGDEDQSDGEGGPYDGYEAAKTAAVRRRALEPHSLDDYCVEKILEWLEGDAAMRESKIPSIAIVASDPEVVGANARDALAFVASTHFKRSVWINLLKMHTQYLMEKRYTIARFLTTLLRLPRVVLTRNPPRPIDILCYILCECQEQNKQKKYHGEVQEHNVKNQAYKDRSTILGEISAKFQDEKMQKKVEEIVSKIKEVEASLAQESETDKSEDTTDGAMETTYDTHWTNKSLGILLQALNFLLIKPGETSRKSFGEGTDKILWDHDKIIKETAKKLKQHIEAVEPDLAKKDATDPEQKEKEEAKPVFPVSLDLFRYEHILHKMFPANEPQQAQEATTTCSPYGSRAAGADSSATATTSLGNAELKEIIHNIVHGILQDILKEQQQQFLQLPEATGKPAAKQEQATQHKPIHNEEDEYASAMKEAKQKIPQIKSEIKEQVTIQMVIDKIKTENFFQSEKTLIIIEDDGNYVSDWEEIRNALNQLLSKGSAMIVTTRNIQRAKEICNPPRDPIRNSIVSLYHDILLQFTSQSVNKDASQIFRDILDKCYPNEFCMKIFTHAIYANPNRSNEDLCKLLGSLDSQKSLGSINAKKMIKFSYNDLRKEYKACLLYLAIYPPGYPISRSTLVGRWVVEGLIAKEEWPNAVHHAERCFEALVNRWLVYPSDIGGVGKAKSCVVGDLVHEFITKIAKKQHIVEPRLSHHLARHFSIFNDVRLRGSDGIDTFLKKLRGSSEFLMLKVLDLEGCHCFQRNQYYLNEICRNILLLKYLSLKGTDITQIPSEINNLYELEVLDIRQTMVPSYATRSLLLLKLKRLLAGHTDLSSRNGDTDNSKRDNMPLFSFFQSKRTPLLSSVQAPLKIRKMANLEVLSNVKVSWTGKELKDIGKLWKLRKLGVVIDDKENLLNNLLVAISDLYESLRSLSIYTVPSTIREGTSPNGHLLKNIRPYLRYRPKLLESLSIHGSTHNGDLLSILAEGLSKLVKVTLSSTSLNQDDMKVLSELPHLRYFRLRYKGYTADKLTFKQDGFKNIKSFLVEGSNMMIIEFQNGAAPELEKIVLSSTNIKSLCRVGGLPKLKELELKKNRFLLSITEEGGTDEKYTRSKLTFKKDEFQKLKYFLVEGPNMETDITFEDKAALELEKVVLSFANIMSFSGANNLLKFKHLELKCNKSLLLSSLENAKKISKVILHSTWLDRGNLQILAKKPRIRCLVLSQNSYDESQLIFNNNDFPELNILIIECSTITNISFTKGAAPKLEKIVWSFSKMNSLSGITNLSKLKELEFTGDFVPDQVRDSIKTHPMQPFLTLKQPQHQDQGNGRVQEDDNDGKVSAACSWLLKNKYWPAAGQDEDLLAHILHPSIHP
ncbi:hypothetical protein HU200_064017 [Digitaria exilis]|uniref:Rx N-terminal domain-containing protein n=1 Tax=Digitaria exilis TaxID=1010633 RepID=A0A835DVV1_9POAL|nr:hypothetical protein HU200_064017 [Digitaria exilis]CAB3486471.1 unnamed protein product [Digitaria exilis]